MEVKAYRYTFVIMFLLINFLCLSQERINPQQLSFIKESKIVTNTIGWSKEIDG